MALTLCLRTNLTICQSSTYTPIPGGRNWPYFCSTGSGFWDMGRFSKCHIWAWNLAIAQSARSCTCTLFLPQGVEIELVLALWAAVSEIQANFQNCHIWAWNLAIDQSARSCTYTLFLPQGRRNWAYFHSTVSGFRDVGQFWKLPYLVMNLGQEVAHILPKQPPPSPESQISLCFALRLPISKIMAVLHFPIGHHVKFQSFFLKFNLKFQNSYK